VPTPDTRLISGRALSHGHRVTPAGGAAGAEAAPRQARFQSDLATRFRIFKTTPKPREKLTKPDAETYLFSDLVLDLGSEGTRGVRDAEEKDEVALNTKWHLAASKTEERARERILMEAEDVNRSMGNYGTLQRIRGGSSWRIRDSDVVSIALRGAPSFRDSSPAGHLASGPNIAVESPEESFLLRNGIPHIVWEDDGSLLRWMLARRDPRRASSIPAHNLDRMIDYHASTKPDSYLSRRLLSLISRTEAPVTVTGPLQRRIYEDLLEGDDKRAKEFNTPYDVLSFIALLQNVVEKKGSGLLPEITLVGLQYSAEVHHLEFTARYLEMAIEDKENDQTLADQFSRYVANALWALSRNLDLAAATSPKSISRRDVLHLLAGDQFQRPASQDSFRIAMADPLVRREAYPTYIQLLARLGALRTLWHEWRELVVVEPNMGSEHSPLRYADLIARSLLDAHDVILAYRPEIGTPDGTLSCSVEQDIMSIPEGAMPPSSDSTEHASDDYNCRIPMPDQLPALVAEALEEKSIAQYIASIQELIGAAVEAEQGMEE